jgi:predicted nucleic acid-binding protein
MLLCVISDTSVLIDIDCGGIMKEIFSLPYQFAVPDILFAEELAERHADLLRYGLITKTMSPKCILETLELRKVYAKTSVNDLLALVLAKHEGCDLLTGDKALREVAGIFNVTVHGTIWLVKQAIKHGKLTIAEARDAFERMKTAGSRLPWAEVNKLLQQEDLYLSV